MFGFEKKEIGHSRKITHRDIDHLDESQLEQLGVLCSLIASKSLHALHEVQTEILFEFDRLLVENQITDVEHMATIFFYGKDVFFHQSILAYNTGFLMGMCQAFNLESSFAIHISRTDFAKLKDTEIEKFTSTLNLSKTVSSYLEQIDNFNEIDFEDLPDDSQKAFVDGLADGKGFGDYEIRFENDYSIIRDKEAVELATLSGLRALLPELMRSYLRGDLDVN